MVSFFFTENTQGSFLMTRYSLQEMKKRNYGCILLMASMAGKEVCIYIVEVVFS